MHHTPAGEETLEDPNVCLVNLVTLAATFCLVYACSTGQGSLPSE
jgi:hypothetical protein